MEQWSRLRCESDELPALHVKATFNDKGYSIRLTDLSRVWGETLSQKDIFERARRRNCSIDPSEDNEQFDIFLGKLKSALSQADRTSAALSAANDGKLKLHLEARLPSPLPSFEWEVDLELACDGIIGDEVVSPLIHQIDDLNRRCQSLIAEIQAKDKIIYKTTDRLETSGHDLDAVFPGISKIKLSRKKSQREQLAAHIRGLGEFDEEAWAAQFGVEPNDSTLPPNSVDAILASLPASTIKSSANRASTKWWQDIPADQQIDLGGTATDDRASRTPDRTTAVNGRSSPEEKDDDDFQVQATPPHLRGHSSLPTTQGDVDVGGADDKPLADDDSTEDEDDLDGPPQNKSKPASRSAKSAAAEAPKATEPKTTSSPPQANHIPEAATTHGPFTHDEDTEDEDDLDGPSQPSQKAPPASQLPSRQKSQTPQPTSQTAAPSPRKKLGTLGGRARTKSPSVDQLPPTNSREPTPTHPSPKPKQKSKLGTLGGSKAKANPPSPKSNSPPPARKQGSICGKRGTASTAASASLRAATASTTPEPPRRERLVESRQPERKVESVEPENQEERANAKRDALKRELEAKAKAPAKKKRKF